MAKEFYGYVQRERPTAVNWADVSKKITDKLDQDEKQRQEEQSSVLSAAQEFETGLRELKPGEREVITPVTEQVFVSQVGYQLGDASEALKNQMLSKQISKKDYNAAMSSLKGEYNLFKTFNQNYNTSYQKYQEDVQTGDLGPVNTAAGALLEKFGQVDNLEPSYKNGRLVFQRYDGSTPEGDEMTMKDLNGLMMFKSDKFKTTEEVSDVSKAVQKASSRTVEGRLIIEDPEKNPKFKEALNKLSASKFTDQGQIRAANYLVQDNLSGYKRVSFENYDPNDTETIFMTIKDGIPSVVPQQIEKVNQDAIKSFSEAVRGTLPFESVVRKETPKTGPVSAVSKLKSGTDFVKSVNNVLTTGTDFQSSMSSIATTLGADDVNYELDEDGEISAYIFDFPEKSKLQRTIVNVKRNGEPISNEKITQDLYSIYQKATNDKSSFTDVWSRSNITTTTNYNPGKTEVFKANPGERDSDISVKVGFRAIPLNEYLNRPDAKVQTAYSTNFSTLGADMPGYVPESFRGNVGVKETAENLEISMGKRTPFRNNPVNFKIPANLSPSQHEQVIESLNKVLWENPTLTRGPEFLKLFQAELDATLGDDVVDII